MWMTVLNVVIVTALCVELCVILTRSNRDV